MFAPVSCLLPFPSCQEMEVYGSSYTLHQVLFPQSLQTLSIYKGPIQEAGISNHQITRQRGSSQLCLAFLGKGVPLAGSFAPGSGPVLDASPPGGL